MDNNSINNALASLKPKDKDPYSVSVLSRWIDEAENQLKEGRSGRLSWIVATVITTAMLQQVVDNMGKPLFLLKGGSLLQHRLGLVSRPTKDLDGLVRSDIDEFIASFDAEMRNGWGAIGFSRSEIRRIKIPGKSIDPRQFDVTLSLKGRTWRKITVEISPDEGKAGSYIEEFPSPSLAGFGLPTPDGLAGLAMSYQLAQKIHAATELHNPPEYVNNRARDLVDIILIKNLILNTGAPTEKEIVLATKDIYKVRAEEAARAGRIVQSLPPIIVAYPHWKTDYKAAADLVELDMSMEDAIAEANKWLSSLFS